MPLDLEAVMRLPIAAGMSLLTLSAGSLLIAAMPAGGETRSSYEFRHEGAVTGVSRGEATFGVVEGDPLEGRRFSLELGSGGNDGAVIFSRVGSDTPEPGTYQVAGHLGAGADHGFRALILTGPADDPQGVFWARSGTLTITASAGGQLHGSFRLHAVGFLADDAEQENREIRLNGAFRAEG